MPCNVGRIEQAIRILLGIVLLGVGMFSELSTLLSGIAFVAGAIALITGTIGFCPVWSLVGLNTCPTHGPNAK